jgi:hypothetical protein
MLLVLDMHLATAPAAHGQARQQRRAIAGCPARAQDVAGRVVGEALLIGHVLLPADIRSIRIAVQRRPVCPVPPPLTPRPTGQPLGNGAAPPIGEGPGVGGIMENAVERPFRGRLPEQVAGVGAAALAPRQPQAVVT